MKGIHDGHRERMKNRFLKNGLSSFEQHEILEILLFYTIPRKNTNNIAHNLIGKFGSVNDVFNANIELLKEVDGITQNSAVFIKMIPQLCQIYLENEFSSSKISSLDDIKNIAISQYVGEVNEILKVIFLSDNCKYIDCVDMGTDNSANTLTINLKKIIERAENHKSSYVLLLHNHPNGDVKPSSTDINSTQRAKEIFKSLGMTLVDHIVVSNNQTFSMRDFGYI